MAVIESAVEIARPCDRVFDYVVDMTNELKWNPGVQSMRKLTSGPPGVGTKYLAKWTQSRPIVVECVRADRPSHVTFLKERGVAALGGDVANEASPSLVPGIATPMHLLAIVAMGMPSLPDVQLRHGMITAWTDVRANAEASESAPMGGAMTRVACCVLILLLRGLLHGRRMD